MTRGAFSGAGLPPPTTAGGWGAAVVAAVHDPSAGPIAEAIAARAPASYRESTPPAEAALDAVELAGVAPLAPADHTGAAFDGHYRFVARSRPGGGFRLRRFGDRPVELTALVPVLESAGLVVEAAVPHRIDLGAPGEVWVDDVGVHLRGAGAPTLPAFDPATDGPRLVDALDAAVHGLIDVDPLNGLVTSAGLSWREVAVLRAYVRYWAQVPAVVPAGDVEAAILAFPAAARALVDYFAARFDPARSAPRDAGTARAAVVEALGAVPALHADRALRTCLSLIDATVRTGAYRTPRTPHEPVVVKLDGAAVGGLPRPVPWRETWVHSPAVEGVHLRAGPVARGGLRWSERPADLRTEVLDLMVAQVKKNAAIVPTGAKGGFVCRGARRVTPADVRAAYEVFVGALLDVTDNLAGGEVVPPPGVVSFDGADPYLVVAADRGTAALSDVANGLSAARGFWLGDAFAAGGSRGYNHKAMGITARGAWLAVRRHFHQLDVDVQRDPLRVAGVGDMSGDVFGNGMLSSEAIRLVAAFDHRHVFVDPDPDPVRAGAERRRLAALPHSSWADYDPAALSPGGGVWPRDAKSVPLSPAARRALGTDAEELTPPALVSAILEAPVDLLWFGGIGTFVKDAAESDAEIGDRANDEVRVTADRLRARVVAEGGNLGVTQRGRIRYSRRGGRINADFIDNAAGVATSDREVNCKILLSLAIEHGRLDAADRDAVLARAEHGVAAEVLRQVDRSLSALGRAVPDSAEELDAYVALIGMLERTRGLDRGVESLPDDAELAVRREAGAGLIRPELAVLLAYATIDLAVAVEHSEYARAASLAPAIASYWPPPVGERAGDLAGHHRLHDQIVATQVASEVTAHLGIVWAHETAAELGRPVAEVLAAYWAAREVLRAHDAWTALDDGWSAQTADAESALRATVARAVGDVARAYLRRGAVSSPGPLIEIDRALATTLGRPVTGTVNRLVAAGAGADLAAVCAAVAARARVADVGPVARASGRDPGAVLATLDALDRAAGLAPVVAALRAGAGGGRWASWFRRSVLDDIARWRQRAAADVLADSSPDPVSAWSARHDSELVAAGRLLAEVPGAGDAAPTVAAVALRRLPAL